MQKSNYHQCWWSHCNFGSLLLEVEPCCPTFGQQQLRLFVQLKWDLYQLCGNHWEWWHHWQQQPRPIRAGKVPAVGRNSINELWWIPSLRNRSKPIKRRSSRRWRHWQRRSMKQQQQQQQQQQQRRWWKSRKWPRIRWIQKLWWQNLNVIGRINQRCNWARRIRWWTWPQHRLAKRRHAIMEQHWKMGRRWLRRMVWYQWTLTPQSQSKKSYQRWSPMQCPMKRSILVPIHWSYKNQGTKTYWKPQSQGGVRGSWGWWGIIWGQVHGQWGWTDGKC